MWVKGTLVRAYPTKFVVLFQNLLYTEKLIYLEICIPSGRHWFIRCARVMFSKSGLWKTLSQILQQKGGISSQSAEYFES